MGTQTPCSEPDCPHEAAPKSGGRCHAHKKRRTRGRQSSAPLRPYRLSPGEQLGRAAISYADAADLDETAYARAEDLLHYWARAYAKAVEAAVSIPAPAANDDAELAANTDAEVSERSPEQSGC
jgi:hypothetical protein